jgi:predicted DsbA family dithiol-disulfide isomerase
MRACHLDNDAPRLPEGKFTGPGTPYVGNLQGPEVIVFYDPNCPHCREFQATFRGVMERLKDRAHFTIVPRLLWDESIPQAAALKLAEGSGKYFELWQAMLDHQPGPHHGMSVDEIATLFREFGLDTQNLAQRLDAARPAVVAATAQARAAGINGIPAIFIDRYKVWGPNRSEACLSRLIDRVGRARAASSTGAP